MKILFQKQGIYTRYFLEDGTQIAEVCQPPATINFNSDCLAFPLVSCVPLVKPQYQDAIAKIEELHRGALLDYGGFDGKCETIDIEESE